MVFARRKHFSHARMRLIFLMLSSFLNRNLPSISATTPTPSTATAYNTTKLTSFTVNSRSINSKLKKKFELLIVTH